MTLSDNEIKQIIDEFLNMTTERQYIGARYVPIFGRKNEDSILWDNTAPYEPLTIVLYQGNSYTSRQYVPIGVEITNEEFWANTGNYNAQVEQYRQEVSRIGSLLPSSEFTPENTVKNYIDDVNYSRTRTFDNVQEMKNSETMEPGLICGTLGFYSPGDGGAAWYKVKSDGDANDMDVFELSNGYFAELETDVVNVLQFGAKGDGVSNDYNVIAYCFQKAYEDEKTIVFPSDKEYLVVTGVSISNCPNSIIMESPIVYKGNGTALSIIGGADSFNGKFKFYVASNNTNATQGSIGLQLENFSTSQIDIKLVEGFETGVKLKGNNAGFGYNTINLGNIHNCGIGIYLIAGSSDDSVGWINENLFLGGRIWCDSNNAYSGAFTGIKLEGVNTHTPNANVFIKPSCEYALYAVSLINASFNRFLHCRTEHSTNNISIDENSIANEMTITYGNETPLPNDAVNINNNVLLMSDVKMIRYSNIVYDSGFIPDYAFSNENWLNAGKDLAYVEPSSNLPAFKNLYKGVKYNNGISIGTRNIGVMIDCSNQKDFCISVQSLKCLGYRVGIILFDENDDYIYPDNGVIGLPSRPFTKSNTSITGLYVYINGSDVTNQTYFHICNDAKKAFVYVRIGDTTDRLQSFRITSPKDNRIALSKYIGNLNNEGINTIPTCEGKIGDFCKDYTGSSFGWRYNGTNWVTV